MVGPGRVFQVGAALGVVGYLACGLAPSFPALVAGRVLQGVAGGSRVRHRSWDPTLASAPHARARAVGLLNASIGVASAVGPALAGGLVEVFGWRSVFLLRVPVGLGLVAWALVSLPRGRLAAGYRRLRMSDFVRAPVPRACALAFAANAAIFAIWLLGPFLLVGLRALSPAVAGAIVMLTPLTMAACAPLAGRLAERLGGRALIAGGLALEGAGLWLIGDATATTPLWILALAFAGAGAGLGLFQVPNMAALMGAFGEGLQGAAGGLSFLARTLGIVTGVLSLASIFAARRLAVGFESAFVEAFRLAAVGVRLGALIACRRPVQAARTPD
jgi:MFS family permease